MKEKVIGYRVFTQEPCEYCGVALDYTVSVEQFEKWRDYFSAQWHECTSSTDTIFGGGPCCNPRGHICEAIYE